MFRVSFYIILYFTVVNADSEVVSRIKQNLDPTRNPCDNFYKFACGNSNITNVAEKAQFEENPVYESVKNLIQKGTGSNFRPFQLIDDVYKTCMSDDAIGKPVVEDLLRIFEFLGGWPLLDGPKWKTKDYMWVDFILHTKLMGLEVNPFLRIDPVIYPGDKNFTIKFSIVADPPEFGRSINSSSDPLLTAYTSYIEKSCKLLNCKTSEIKDIVNLEWGLSEIKLKFGKSYELKELTYEELKEKYPSVFWFKLIQSFIRSSPQKLNTSEMAFLVSPSLSEIIELLDHTNPHILSNYGSWKVFQFLIPFLTPDFQELKHEYCLTQMCFDLPRPDFCTKVVESFLKPAVNLLFAKNYFSTEVETAASEMVANIQENIKNLIRGSSWITEDFKKKALDVLNAEVLIGFAEKKNKDEDFEKYFEDLEIDTTNFVQTLMNLEKFDSKRRILNSTGLGPRNIVNPTVVTIPVYAGGRLDLPMAALQKPFFDINHPIINYGTLGKAIAQEFLNEVVYVLKDSPGSKEKTQCFEEQFRNFSSEAKFFRRSNWISDQLAYKVSYLASKSLNSVNIPELPYTGTQIYWISSLQNVCARFSEEKKDKIFEFKVMKGVTSVSEFSTDFNCQKFESCPYL